jgi:hypothetical protein
LVHRGGRGQSFVYELLFTRPSDEAGISQPTLDVIRNMAIAFGVASDQLLFDKDERGPDDTLKLQFEAVSRFDPESKKVVRQVLDSMILQQEARRWSSER